MSLGDLGDLEGGGLLGLVGVGRARVDLELAELAAAQLVLREHAPDRLLDDLAGVLLQQLADRGGGQAARVAGVAVGQLGGLLVAGQRHLLGVDDDDEVTGVHVRGVDRLVLAPQQVGGVHGQAAEHHVGGVDDVPLAPDVGGLRAVRAHGDMTFTLLAGGCGSTARRPRSDPTN